MKEKFTRLKSDFETLYFEVRLKEKRIYSDEELINLPDIIPHHPYFKEWEVRKRSYKRLIKYLEKKQSRLRILEIGCGNGWLCSKLASIPQSIVKGIDINEHEINQAIRVFKKENLEFKYTYPENLKKESAKWDIIIFAASFQYFRNPESILGLCMELLDQRGEIHIMDSPFYKSNQIKSAMIRSNDYYESLGYREMGCHYFHHSFETLNEFNYMVLFNPFSLVNRIFKLGPFFWISIRNQ